MSKPVLVTPEGLLLSDKQSPPEVKKEEESFDQMAARSAEQQSTPIRGSK
jgi:hypothetical protein